MYYGQKIYSDEEIYAESITVQEKFVELYHDVLFYIYTDQIGLTVHPCNWALYKRPDANHSFVLVTKGTSNNATIKINLNNYGLQLQNNNFKLVVYEEDKLVAENIFWYYYKPYTEASDRSAWLVGDVHVPVREGGGGMGVAPMYIEKPFPNIIVTSLKEDEESLKNINIYINNFISLNI